MRLRSIGGQLSGGNFLERERASKRERKREERRERKREREVERGRREHSPFRKEMILP